MWVPHAMNHLLEKAFIHSQLQDAGTGDVSIHILQIQYSWCICFCQPLAYFTCSILFSEFLRFAVHFSLVISNMPYNHDEIKMDPYIVLTISILWYKLCFNASAKKNW